MNIRKIFIGSVCSINTCLNGGTCRQTASTMAECLCATGFTGPTCSLRMSGFYRDICIKIEYFR
jgi:hypothetical protein